MVTRTHRDAAEGMLKNGSVSEDARLTARSILTLADAVDALRASLIDTLRDPEWHAPSLTRELSGLHACPDCGSPTARDKCGACAVGRRAS